MKVKSTLALLSNNPKPGKPETTDRKNLFDQFDNSGKVDRSSADNKRPDDIVDLKSSSSSHRENEDGKHRHKKHEKGERRSSHERRNSGSRDSREREHKRDRHEVGRRKQHSVDQDRGHDRSCHRRDSSHGRDTKSSTSTSPSRNKHGSSKFAITPIKSEKPEPESSRSTSRDGFTTPKNGKSSRKSESPVSDQTFLKPPNGMINGSLKRDHKDKTGPKAQKNLKVHLPDRVSSIQFNIFILPLFVQIKEKY